MHGWSSRGGEQLNLLQINQEGDKSGANSFFASASTPTIRGSQVSARIVSACVNVTMGVVKSGRCATSRTRGGRGRLQENRCLRQHSRCEIRWVHFEASRGGEENAWASM